MQDWQRKILQAILDKKTIQYRKTKSDNWIEVNENFVLNIITNHADAVGVHSCLRIRPETTYMYTTLPELPLLALNTGFIINFESTQLGSHTHMVTIEDGVIVNITLIHKD